MNISQSVVSRLWTRYHRPLTSTDLQQYLRRVRGVTVSRQTIRNRVHVGGLRARRAQVVLPLKVRHRRARLTWCTKRRRVWRRVGERYTDPARVAHDRYGGGSVMVWGGITMTGKTDLHVCQGRVTGVYYRDNVLAPYVIPLA